MQSAVRRGKAILPGSEHLGAYGSLARSLSDFRKTQTGAGHFRTSDVAGSTGLLTQTACWNAMQAFIRPGDVIIAEDGTSSIGAGQMTCRRAVHLVPGLHSDPKKKSPILLGCSAACRS
jgi:hypothetical protein